MSGYSHLTAEERDRLAGLVFETMTQQPEAGADLQEAARAVAGTVSSPSRATRAEMPLAGQWVPVRPPSGRAAVVEVRADDPAIVPRKASHDCGAYEQLEAPCSCHEHLV
jgi:hypothetical protein